MYYSEINNYTGTLKNNGLGDSYTWSFKAFKRWKRRFNKEYETLTGYKFKEKCPSAKKRADIYKKLLGFSRVDVFERGEITRNLEGIFDQLEMTICQKIADSL